MGVNEVGERRSDFAIDDGVLWGGFSVEILVLKEDRMRSRLQRGSRAGLWRGRGRQGNIGSTLRNTIS
jgi:hypothetical protein